MKAYALVQGPRRKVLAVSDKTYVLYALGAEMFDPGRQSDFRVERHERAICKANGAYIVRVEYSLGEPITTTKKEAAQ